MLILQRNYRISVARCCNFAFVLFLQQLAEGEDGLACFVKSFKAPTFSGLDKIFACM